MDDSSWAQLVVKHGLIRESYQIFCRKRTPHPAFSCHKSKTLRDLHLITNFSVSISLSGPIRISQTRSTWHNAAPISDLESKFELVTTIMNLCFFSWTSHCIDHLAFKPQPRLGKQRCHAMQQGPGECMARRPWSAAGGNKCWPQNTVIVINVLKKKYWKMFGPQTICQPLLLTSAGVCKLDSWLRALVTIENIPSIRVKSKTRGYPKIL